MRLQHFTFRLGFMSAGRGWDEAADRQKEEEEEQEQEEEQVLRLTQKVGRGD